MKKISILGLLLFSIFTSSFSTAANGLELIKITDNAYAIVGELGNRSPENLGNNATFGVVVTDKGVVLIDSGATYKGAQAIHNVIKTVTDKPIVIVINSGGQDHRWLGNEYFKEQGAKIIASKAAVEDHKARLQDQFFRLGTLVGDEGIKGTNAVYADTVFESNHNFELGNVNFEVTHAGQAHTPGDSFVWLPKQSVMFTGDIVYTERMLGVGTQSNSKSWLAVYEAMAAHNPKYLVPGHGKPTTLEKANKDSYEYLQYLRKSISDFIENDGDISEISKVDLSRYHYLFNSEMLSGRNAQQVYSELEFE